MAATHLTATMSVLRFHLGQRSLLVTAAADIVKELALRLATDDATSADLVLADKLKRATGCSAGELAVYAEDWPA